MLPATEHQCSQIICCLVPNPACRSIPVFQCRKQQCCQGSDLFFSGLRCIQPGNDILNLLRLKPFQYQFRQNRFFIPAITGTHDRSEYVTSDGIAASVVVNQIPPAPGPEQSAFRIPAIEHGTRSCYQDGSWSFHSTCQCNLVVAHQAQWSRISGATDCFTHKLRSFAIAHSGHTDHKSATSVHAGFTHASDRLFHSLQDSLF